MLYLTYDNMLHADGFGSQLQRMLSIYCLAKEFECEYIHSGFHDIQYQGLKCLEENKTERVFVEKANEIFKISDTDPGVTDPKFSHVETVKYITLDTLKFWKNEATYKNISLRILYAHKVLDTQTNIFSHMPSFPWIVKSREDAATLQIAVHVRRGELFLVDSDRMLPNEYYYNIMMCLQRICEALQISYEFIIYTEQPTKVATISPEHPGMCNRFESSKLIGPNQTDLSIFESFPNMRFKINTDPFEAFIELVNSDILVCSLSSFSYTAALLKKSGHVLIPKKKFWHGSLSEWIDTESTDDFIRLLQVLRDR